MADYDVVVLGGGSAGSSAADAATAAGARTAMINDGELGGLCILRGCMPTKAMLASAHAVHEAKHLEPFGARLTGSVSVDFEQVMRRKDAQVERFKLAKIRAIESSSYDVIDARARFGSAGGVELNDGRTLSASGYVIATGSSPVILPIPGIDGVPVLTSDDVMRLSSPPESLIVLGAGPIGLELAQFFARVGTEVLLVNRSPLLCHHDEESGQELARALAEESGLELVLPATIDRVRKEGSGLVASIRHRGELSEHRADALLMATGRRAALDQLALERVGLRPDDGRLAHDASMRTSVPGIYVAGDATGSYEILHIANEEGRIAGHNAAGGTPGKQIDYRLKMQVFFTDPTFAQIGWTHAEATEAGADPVTGMARFPETGRAITMGTRYGLWKLTADRQTREILGSTILGPRAEELMHLVMLMVHYRTRVDEILDLPWYHPTLPEVLLDLGRDLLRRIEG